MDSESALNALGAEPTRWYSILAAFEATDDNELSVVKNEVRFRSSL